jgi:hypothetical protein
MREKTMPARPDRQTLHLRAPDRRTPAEAVAVARRELARRPRAVTRWEVSLTPADRALVSFGERYPSVVERFHAGVLWSAANGHARPGKPGRRPCAWDLARAWQRRHGGPPLRVDDLGRLLLGDPCPSCQAALGWRPPAPPRPRKPKHRAAHSNGRSASPRSGTNRTAAARSSTSRRRYSRAELAAATRAGLTAAAGPRISPELAAENAAACRRMGVDPARYPHLTRPRP